MTCFRFVIIICARSSGVQPFHTNLQEYQINKEISKKIVTKADFVGFPAMSPACMPSRRTTTQLASGLMGHWVRCRGCIHCQITAKLGAQLTTRQIWALLYPRHP
jgi:hypothetical protein